MDEQRADDQPKAPLLLICTVGGSPQPIATALRLLRPDVVWFLVSDGKTGESSRAQVESPVIEYDRSTGARGTGLKFADGCPAESRVSAVPADDPDGAYKVCRSVLAQARWSYPGHRLIADYTGGTKSMTGALLMAAFAQPGVEVQFMAGERRDLVQVQTGSERPHVMAADFVLAERDFAAAEQAVDSYDYAPANGLLEELRKRLQAVGAKPPGAWRRRLEQAVAWTGTMALWDAFDHRRAAQRLPRGESPLKNMLAATGHHEPLLALAGAGKHKPRWEICADLWRNSQRRGERGRYDDAVARLYRLLEATAQAHLWSRYALETHRIAPAELPEEMRHSSFIVKKDPKTGTEYAQLALNQTVELLRHRDKNDPFVAIYAGDPVQDDRLQGPGWLTARNHSILAHGFRSIDGEAWEEARNWVDTHLTPFFASAAFPQLPRQIPKMQTTLELQTAV